MVHSLVLSTLADRRSSDVDSDEDLDETTDDESDEPTDDEDMSAEDGEEQHSEHGTGELYFSRNGRTMLAVSRAEEVNLSCALEQRRKRRRTWLLGFSASTTRT